MTDPRETETKTPKEAAPQEFIAEPGGRAKVWIWVVVGLALLAAVFIVRRPQEPDLTPSIVTVEEPAPPSDVIPGGPIPGGPPEPR